MCGGALFPDFRNVATVVGRGRVWKSLELEGVRGVAVISHSSPSVLLLRGVPSAPRDSFRSNIYAIYAKTYAKRCSIYKHL